MNTTIHPKRAADLHASEVRENERAELAYAAAELLETCAEAMAGSPDNGDVRRLRNVCVDFAKAVLEHVQAEHSPGAAADTLHAAAREFVQHLDRGIAGMEQTMGDGVPVLIKAARIFRDAERERMSRTPTEPDL